MSMTEQKRKAVDGSGPPSKKFKPSNGTKDQKYQKPTSSAEKETVLNGQTSREAHIKQKEVKRERQAAKPNADSIARSKKIWEKLRIKSAVPKDERKALVDELFQIIDGRVKEFVFKHDSVRVIQCALKYANPLQKQKIAEELRGSYRELAESKYAKFLVAKLITEDKSSEHIVRDLIVPEFYGHVKRLVRHPEASWIMDDIYRTLATKEQKASLLREWYGGEFAVPAMQAGEVATADLSEILKASPGKKAPIMSHLKEMTNQLVQKKTTGFTMLHDALCQYFLNCAPGSTEHNEFLEMLRDDEEGDLFRNLAFTKSGSKVVCLALAYGNSKDRRTILKHYKTHIKLMAYDGYAHTVLLTAYDVIDDTVMTAKAIVPELTCKELDSDRRQQELLAMVASINARIPLLYVFNEKVPKWLADAPEHKILDEVKAIRNETSKKESSIRRTQLVEAISQPLFDFIAESAEALVGTSFGSQFVSEVLIGGVGEKDAAINAIAAVVQSENKEAISHPTANRLLKTLVQGGRFDSKTKMIQPCEPPLDFANKLYKLLSESEQLKDFATGSNVWSIVAMLESSTFAQKDELLAFLKTVKGDLEAPKDDSTVSGGSKVLLQKIGSGSAEIAKSKKAKKQK